MKFAQALVGIEQISQVEQNTAKQEIQVDLDDFMI